VCACVRACVCVCVCGERNSACNGERFDEPQRYLTFPALNKYMWIDEVETTWPDGIQKRTKKCKSEETTKTEASLKKSNKMQHCAYIYLPLNDSTCFGRPSRPSSGVHKTAVAASGTDHNIWGASFFKRNQIRTPFWSRLRKLDSQILWSVPEAATTVLCTPDDGRDGRPKHVE